jgi:threonine dehydratase
MVEEKRLSANLNKEVLEAFERIKKYIRETPLEYSPFLSQLGDCNVFLKLENLQITGSFKLRGAMNKLFSLDESEKQNRVITASSGNHAAAFAYLLKKFGYQGKIVLPENVAPTKIESLKWYGIDLLFFGDDCVKAEEYAKKQAVEKGWLFISPYNDSKIIQGQGTIGFEIKNQLRTWEKELQADCILVPVGGGGLISGIAGYLKSDTTKIEVIGCQPQNSAVMFESLKAGKILDIKSKPTISDGTAGGVENGSLTFELCQKYVDDFILLSEDEIIEAIRLILSKHYMLIEGAAALSVAAFIKHKKKFKNKSVVLVISGARIGLQNLRSVLEDR